MVVTMKEISLTRKMIQRSHKLVGSIDLNATIHIIGCGSTGSIVAENLARTGFNNFVLYDYDKIENHNIGTQRYRFKDIGHYKTDILFSNVWLINPECYIETVGKYTPENKIIEIKNLDIVFCLVDSMKARKMIYNDLYLKGFSGKFFESRTSAYQFDIISTNDFRLNIDRIKGLWFGDNRAVKIPCGEKALMYTNELCGAVLVKELIDSFDSNYDFKYYSFDSKTLEIF